MAAQGNVNFLWLALVGGYVLTALIGMMGAVIVYKMLRGTIDLTKLVSEQDGSASLSRFQFLIFTFVIATSLLLMVIAGIAKETPGFPTIDPSILGLIGISGASYVVSKGIQKNSEDNKATADAQARAGDQAAKQPAGWPNAPQVKS